MARIDLRGITRVVDGRTILNDISLEIGDGEFVGLAGPSGAGKSSLLRVIAGFDQPDRGRIYFDGVDFTSVPTRQRDLGVVFQQTTLFGNRTVGGNLALPLEYRSIPRREREKRVEAESRAHHLSELLDRWPSELSGGEARMTEIARALVRAPRLLLLDEPLSGIDQPSAARLRQELRTLQEGYGLTTVFASNNSHELMTMPTKLAVLQQGELVQVGDPSTIRASPLTRQVAAITGPIRELSVEVVDEDGGTWVVAPGLRLRVWAPAVASHAGRRIVLGVRPEHVDVDPAGPVEMTAGRRSFLTGAPVTTLESPAGTITTTAEEIDQGATVRVRFSRWHLFEESGRIIATV